MMFGQRHTSLRKTAVLAAVLSGAFATLPCYGYNQGDGSEMLGIDFRFDNSAIDLNYHNNSNTVDRLDSLFNKVGADKVLSVQAVSVSSPEGSYSYNIELSKSRAQSTANFISDRFPQVSGKVSVLPATESWSDLVQVVENDSKLSDMSKTKILEVLGLDCSVNDRKALMKWTLGVDENVGDVYEYLLKNCYEDIRFSGFSVTYLAGNDTMTLGSLPEILPVEEDIPSVLTESDVKAVARAQKPAEALVEHIDETNSIFSNTISTQVEVPEQGLEITEEKESTPNIIESETDDKESVAQAGGVLTDTDSGISDSGESQEAQAESQEELTVSQSSLEQVTIQEQAQVKEVKKAKAERQKTAGFDWRWLLLPLLLILVVAIILLVLMFRRVKKENASLKEQILIINSESKSEIERVRNVERVEELNVDTPDDKLMRDIMDVVNENISNPELNVEFIADKIGLSRSYLHRRFKSIVQVAPASFIRSIRMNAAAKMLREGKLDINQISSAVGFSSQSSFTTAFKTYYGMTPTEFTKS